MTYRDENATLRAKVGELEAQLGDAEAKLAALRGTTPAAAVESGETLGQPSGLGVPTTLRIEKVIDGALTPQGYEAIASLLSQRLQMATTQVGSRLETLPQRGVQPGTVRVKVENGKTHLTLEADWSGRSPGTWVLAGMAGLFGGLTAAALLHDFLHLGDLMSFAQVLWAGPLVAGLVSIPARRYARRTIEEELAQRRGVFAAMVELAEKHRAPAVRARVSVHEGEASDEPETPAASQEQGAQSR